MQVADGGGQHDNVAQRQIALENKLPHSRKDGSITDHFARRLSELMSLGNLNTRIWKCQIQC